MNVDKLDQCAETLSKRCSKVDISLLVGACGHYSYPIGIVDGVRVSNRYGETDLCVSLRESRNPFIMPVEDEVVINDEEDTIIQIGQFELYFVAA